MRLLFCKVCKTVEEVADYEGHDKVDPLVENLVFKHAERDPLGHGPDVQHSVFRLTAPFPDKVWATDRERVLKICREENKKAGFDAWAYEAMNTYADDALKCFSAHHRPEAGCIDFWDDSKRIGRPTEMGRKIVKDNYKMGAGDPHLCQWCPVYTYVQTEIRFKRGAYK